jgi:hypothetical protein
VAWSKIRWGRNNVYQLTDEDVLWAARAAVFEGGHDPADTLWTWTQMLATWRYKRYGTLKDIIRYQSQPVSPLWNRNGSKCEGARRQNANCADRLLARRDLAQSISWERLLARSPGQMATVVKWATGKLRNPVPRAVDFAAPGVAAYFVRKNPGSIYVKRAGNHFIATADSKQWPANYFTMGKGVLGFGINPLFVTGTVLVLGTAGLLATERGQSAARKLKRRFT